VIGVGRRRVNNMNTNDKSKLQVNVFFFQKMSNNEILFETKANVTLFYAK
jgi:hypothetical protein